MKRTGRNKRSIATLVVLLLSMIVVARGKRVLFIGDSITDGAWATARCGTHRLTSATIKT